EHRQAGRPPRGRAAFRRGQHEQCRRHRHRPRQLLRQRRQGRRAAQHLRQRQREDDAQPPRPQDAWL
ncbi:MAG: hypothetical protein AVDCRST_MAG27-3479, partial [uncultured Craurococcus sp.]